MGEPVTVVENKTMRHGFLRFETNRSFTGMGHESYRSGELIQRNRPPDEIARALFATGKVAEVHVYAQAISVKLSGADSTGIREALEEIFTYYRDGVEVPTAESFGADG